MKYILRFSIGVWPVLLLALLAGMTYRTIVIDGTNDFNADETFAGSSGSTWYISWDADNIYLGMKSVDIGSSSTAGKWVLWYFDTDPQPGLTSGTGFTYGVTYNTQQQHLPFTANYHLRWKLDDTFINLMTYNGSSWVAGDQSGIQHNRTNDYVEIKVPRSALGSPDRIYVSACMINETTYSEWTYYLLPPGQTDGYGVSNQHFLGLTLAEGIQPNNPSTLDLPLPIQIDRMNAAVLVSGHVRLDWSTLSEVDNYGFEVQRADRGAGSFRTLPGSFVPGHGTTTARNEYTYVDQDVLHGECSYRLKQIDLDGSAHFTDALQISTQPGESKSPVPGEFWVSQNYPNPFNPSTTIRYGLPRAAFVKVELLDRLGRVVETLVLGEKEEGYHEFRFDGSHLASGVYFYRVNAGQLTVTRKALFVK